MNHLSMTAQPTNGGSFIKEIMSAPGSTCGSTSTSRTPTSTLYLVTSSLPTLINRAARVVSQLMPICSPLFLETSKALIRKISCLRTEYITSIIQVQPKHISTFQKCPLTSALTQTGTSLRATRISREQFPQHQPC